LTRLNWNLQSDMLSKKEVEHIASLARLGLGDKELKSYQKELSSILDYIEKLKKVDIKGVQGTCHPREVKNVFRKDEVKKQDQETVKKLIEAAPDKKEGHIKVKTILGQ